MAQKNTKKKSLLCTPSNPIVQTNDKEWIFALKLFLFSDFSDNFFLLEKTFEVWGQTKD